MASNQFVARHGIISLDDVIVTGSITATGGINISGSIASASYATSASQAQTAVSSSYPIAVNGSSLYSTSPKAETPSVNNSIFLGCQAGVSASAANNSNFIGQNAGANATNANISNFIGWGAGELATNANISNFIGLNAGYSASSASNSNFIGTGAGNSATNANNSVFIGANAGVGATNASLSNFIGQSAGFQATSASYSTLIGYQAGYNAAGGACGIKSNNIIIGTNISLPDGTRDSINLGAIIFATGSYSSNAGNPITCAVGNGKVGINKALPTYSLDVSGSGNFTNGLTVTGSVVATSFTGSILGTGSYALQALTSSYAANADLLDNRDSTTFANTGSNNFTGTQQVSATNNAISFTSTASFYTDGGMRITKDMYVSGNAFFNNVTVYGTQSINYITSSQLNISTNIISVNTDTPVIRFGGLAVYDSGSTGLTGSLLWDSEENHWIYANPSGSSYDGGMMISGPRNSSGLGNEQGVNNCALIVGQGGDHVTSSAIMHYGNATCFYGTSFISSSGNACFSGQACAATIVSAGSIQGTTVYGSTAICGGSVSGTTGTFSSNVVATGSLIVAPSSTVELQVQSTGVTIGNALTDVHSVTGSLRITGSLDNYILGCNLSIGQTTSALQSAGTGLTIYGATSSEVKFLNSTTGQATTDGTALVTSGNNFTINNREAGVINLGTSNTTRATIASTGEACFACQVCAPSIISSGTICSAGNTTITGCLGIGTNSPSSYCHGGSNRVAEIFNSGTSANSQSHIILSTGASTIPGAIGSVTWVVPNSSAANKMGSYIGADIEANSSTAVCTNIFLASRNNEASPQIRLRIASSGIACFACQICTTSAALSGNVILNRANTSAGNNIEWRTASTLNWYIGTRGLVNNNFYFVNEGLGASNLILDATTGTATFACTVTTSNASVSATYGSLTVGGTGISIADDGNAKLQIGRYSAAACNAYIKMGTNACSLRFTNAADTVDVVVIEKGGNVGIGTSAPGKILNVAANDSTSGNYQARSAVIRIQNTNDVPANSRFAGVQFSFSPGVSTGDSYVIGAVGAVLTDSSTQWSGDLVFAVKNATTATTLTEYARIFTGGVTCFACSVGISTTPSAKLHVQTAINADGIYLSRCTSNKQAIFIAADDAVGAYIAGSTAPDGTATQTDGAGRIILQGGQTEGLQFQTSCVASGAAQSWQTRLKIFNSGVACFRCQVCVGGSIIPLANGTQDLGSSSLRWCTVYTSDLSLNNGIGDYTIVEGENDLFLYNNKQCKVYKFVVQEVCPEIAPAKRSI